MNKCGYTVLLGVAFGSLFVLRVSLADDFFVYASNDQDAEQQAKDTGECRVWATQQTGFDPLAPPPAPIQVQAPQARGGKVVRRAALGAVVGEIADDDASKGAAWGAATGVLGNARSRRRSAEYQEAAVEQAADQYARQRANFNNAYSACLSGRGYTLTPKQ